MLLPDIVYYVLWRPDVLDLSFSARHLINALRTLSNWYIVESQHWLFLPTVWGVIGLLSYLALIHLGIRRTTQPAATEPQGSAAVAGEPGSADVTY